MLLDTFSALFIAGCALAPAQTSGPTTAPAATTERNAAAAAGEAAHMRDLLRRVRGESPVERSTAMHLLWDQVRHHGTTGMGGDVLRAVKDRGVTSDDPTMRERGYSVAAVLASPPTPCPC